MIAIGDAITASQRILYSRLRCTSLANVALPIHLKRSYYMHKKYRILSPTYMNINVHTNYPRSYNTIPNDRAYNMWSICGLGCVNGTIIINEMGRYNWFGIHTTINFIAWRWVSHDSTIYSGGYSMGHTDNTHRHELDCAIDEQLVPMNCNDR